MHNVLLDGFPKDYRGYRINTSFKVGILISKIMSDEEFSEELRIEKSIHLLFIDLPDAETAYRGLIWFLSCGNSEVVVVDEDNDLDREDKIKHDLNHDIPYDFDYDANQIWGGFWSKGVDLETTDMHWFKFMIALQNLNKPVISTLMENRTIDTTGMKGKEKSEYLKLKNRSRVRKILSGKEADEYVKYRDRVMAEQLADMNLSAKEKEMLARSGKHKVF